MYKLTVVSGPNQGTSYAIQEGENAIGRQSGNVVVLPSSRVSKRHCTLVVDNERITLEDGGSANGTFVNGVLSKKKELRAGDRISVGEYVLQLVSSQIRSDRQAPAVPGFGNVLRMPVEFDGNLKRTNKKSGKGAAVARQRKNKKRRRRGSGFPAPAGMFGGAGVPGMPGQSAGSLPGLGGIGGDSRSAGPPNDLKGRFVWIFENQVMPFFYGLSQKNEWRAICLVMLGGFVALSVLISTYPVLESSRQTVIKESARRAKFMARQIAERNTPYLAARNETKTEIGSVDGADGVRLAVLVDLDNRIIAPGARINQYLINGREAVFAVKARDAFRAGRESGLVSQVDPDTIVAIEPVRVLSAAAGQNVTVAMAIVSIDTSLAVPDSGETGLIYSQSFILVGILGLGIALILYRMTLRPFQILNEDMDRVLKGDTAQVTHEFKFEELNPLWDIIGSALQRIPKGGLGSEGGMGFGGQAEWGTQVDEFTSSARLIGEIAPFAVAVCDAERRVIYLNPIFEEITGIRSDGAIGQDLASLARDQAFGALASDLFDRASSGSESLKEDFEFSGVVYKVYCGALGPSGQQPKSYIMTAVRAET